MSSPNKVNFSKYNNIHPPLNQDQYNSTNLSELNGFYIIEGPVCFQRSIHDRFEAEDGNIVHLKQGLIHNDRGPALIDKIKCIVWYLINHDFATLNGPSCVQYDCPPIWNENQYERGPYSEIKMFQYFKKGSFYLHRMDGPAEFVKERVSQHSYWINGNSFKEKDYLNHPEVINLKKRTEVVNKMNSVFKKEKINES